LAIPLLSGVLYWHLGTPKAIETTSAIKDATPTAAQIAAGVAAAQRRVKADPKDTQAWLMLARGQIVTGNDDEAVHAYEEVIKLVPSEPEPFLELAELLARKSGTLAGRPTQLIEQALTASPRYWKALALSGRAAFDRGDYAMALQRWEALKEIVPKDSAALPAIEQGISEVHARLAKSETQSSSKENATVSSVSGTVSLDDGLRARAQAEDTVFIFARMAAGSPMPLAVLRKQVRDLPLNFTLDDSMSMSPQMRISGAKEIVVEARISKSGDAMPKSGDLQGKSAIVAPGDSSLQVRIDTVVP
jgi:cytochrome c-type biogenesis protein CcmH